MNIQTAAIRISWKPARASTTRNTLHIRCSPGPNATALAIRLIPLKYGTPHLSVRQPTQHENARRRDPGGKSNAGEMKEATNRAALFIGSSYGNRFFHYFDLAVFASKP